MKTITPQKKAGILCAWLALAVASLPAANAALTISNVPLYTSVGAVSPNLLVTVDESGSMGWAYVPDSMSNNVTTARFKASNYNGLAYNPSITYNPPPKYNGVNCTIASAPVATCYQNSTFTSAPLNGINTSLGSAVNLSTAYKVAQEYPVVSGNSFDWTAQRDANSTDTPQAAYYYRYWNDGLTPTLSRPSSCLSTWSVATQTANDACYVKAIVGGSNDATPGTSAAQKQNFANWFSFYRSRIMSAISGFMTAFSTTSPTVRLAWQGIHTGSGFCGTLDNTATTYSCTGRSGSTYDNRMRAIGETLTNGKTHKQEFYDWLTDIKLWGNTPTIAAMDRAGKYFQLSGSVTATHPLAEKPPTQAGTLRTCRVNYNLLITDGGWCGDDSTSTTVGNATDSSYTLTVAAPFGSSWTPSAPYKDGQGYNLADIAFYYWIHPMKTGVTYNVPPRTVDPSGTDTAQWLNPRNDPATWLHLNTYTIGLGVSTTMTGTRVDGGTTNAYGSLVGGSHTSQKWASGGSLPIWGGSTFAGDYSLLASATSCPATNSISTAPSNSCWPYTLDSETCAPADISQQYKVYDMWHSAIASRGLFFSADSPKDIQNALTTVMTQVQEAHGAAAALAANSTSLTTTTMIFQAKMDTGIWEGKLLGIPVNIDGTLADPAWDAATYVPAATSRNIFTFNGTSGQVFSSCTTNLSSTQKAYLDADGSGTVDSKCTDRLNWLRGDHSKEARNGGTFRNRVTTKFKDDADYNNNGNRTEYLNASTGFEWVLGDIVDSDPAYVGANDSGYAAATGFSSSERSTYSVFAANNATRRPTVYVGANDGMLHAIDARSSHAASSASGGGSELFAYIPNGVYPNLSKLTDQTYTHQFFVDGSPKAGDAYVNGSWKTVLVGGLNAGGKSIYALDVTDPTTFSASNVLWEYTESDLGLTYSQPQIARLKTGDWVAIFGNGYNSTSDKAYLYIVKLSDGSLVRKFALSSATSNGLSTPVTYDADGDGVIDYVYAGDLQGNLWKFDLTASSASSWTSQILFTTNSNQPITAQPQIGVNPQGGPLIYFGTGQYLTPSDIATTTVQAFYAIWDKPGNASTVPLSSLVLQEITAETTVSGQSVRTVTTNTVDYTGSTPAMGWYLPLVVHGGTSSSERIVTAPLVKNTRVIFTTLIPSASDPCIPGGDSWLMELNPLSGGQPDPLFDFNGDGTYDPGSGMKLSIGSASRPVYLNSQSTAGGNDAKILSGTTGGLQSVSQRCDACSSSSSSSSSGSSSTGSRQIFWRQIQ